MIHSENMETKRVVPHASTNTKDLLGRQENRKLLQAVSALLIFLEIFFNPASQGGAPRQIQVALALVKDRFTSRFTVSSPCVGPIAFGFSEVAHEPNKIERRGNGLQKIRAAFANDIDDSRCCRSVARRR